MITTIISIHLDPALSSSSKWKVKKTSFVERGRRRGERTSASSRKVKKDIEKRRRKNQKNKTDVRVQKAAMGTGATLPLWKITSLFISPPPTSLEDSLYLSLLFFLFFFLLFSGLIDIIDDDDDDYT